MSPEKAGRSATPTEGVVAFLSRSWNCQPLLPIGAALPYAVSATQRQGANSWCWTNRTGGNERAAIHNKQIGYVMRLVPRVHDRALGIISHPRRSHEMTGPRIRMPLPDVRCTGSLQEFTSSPDAMLQYSTSIFRKSINDSGRGDAI